METSATPAAPAARAGNSALRAGFWLGVALVGCKGWNVRGIEAISPAAIGRWMRDWLVVSASDAVYAIGFTLLGAAALHLARKRPLVRRVAWSVLLVLGTLSVFYGVASAMMFEYLRRPLSYPLLYLANDPGSIWSSAVTFISPRFLLAATTIPAIYLVLVLRPGRPGAASASATDSAAAALGHKPRAQLHRPATFVLMALATIAWFAWSHLQVRGAWGAAHQERRLAENPHATFVASFFAPGISFDEPFPPKYLDDFEPVSQRGPEAGRPTAGLRRHPRNVIVVICESVGAQNLSLYGSPYKTWPNMEKEAASSLIFDNYYSHIANTANSLATLILSVYPNPLDYHEITIEHATMPGHSAAGVLKEHGYRTAFISAGYNDFSNQQAFLEGRGFDTIWDAQNLASERLNSWGVEDKYMVDGVLRFIDDDPARPFCIYAWTQGTHHPYGGENDTEPAGWDIVDFKVDTGRWKKMSHDLGRYLNALKETDRQLERLLDGLRQRHLADDTLVVITGDHGEAFGWPHENYGHSGKVNQEDVHVPMILWNPVMFGGAGRSQTVGAHVDLSPTVLDCLGVDLPPSWQGHSLLSPDRPPRAYLYGAIDDCVMGLREGNFKYIYDVSQGHEELYNLAADPLESTSLAAEQPARCKEFRQRLAAWAAYQKIHLAGRP